MHELSPFHPNSLLRIRGDVIQELQCKKVVAIARIGDKRGDQCSSDSLPVWIENQPLRLQARTHLVIDEDPLERIPCNAAFVPVFLSSDGETMLIAMPEVQTTKITLGHLSSDYLHLDSTSEFNHPSFGEDLLYTAEEISQFNNLIHFQRTKQRVLNSMVSSYCEGNTQCGEYQPAKGTSAVFNLQHLEQEITGPFQFLFDWSKKIAQIGNVCSILIVFIVVLSTFYKLYRVLLLTCRHKMGFRQAIKMGWFVDATMLQFIVDKKTSRSQPSNPLRTNQYGDALEPNQVIPAAESETIPLAVVSTSPRRPTSICNPSTSSHQGNLTDIPDSLPVAVPRTTVEPWY